MALKCSRKNVVGHTLLHAWVLCVFVGFVTVCVRKYMSFRIMVYQKFQRLSVNKQMVRRFFKMNITCVLGVLCFILRVKQKNHVLAYPLETFCDAEVARFFS